MVTHGVSLDGLHCVTQRVGLLSTMPTIYVEGGFRFMVFTDDHDPAHVHVWKAGKIAKIHIGDADQRPEPVDPGKMSTRDVRRAVRIVEANQEQFLAAWREIHGA